VARRHGWQIGAVLATTRLFPDDAVLTAEGFVLRPLCEADTADVARACADEVTQRWLPLPSPYTEEVARGFITEFAPAQQSGGAGIVRAVESAGRFVGCISLKETDWAERVTEIGYWVAPWARGLGVAGRATRLLAEWALSDQGLERVELLAATGNVASQRSAERAGFVREGVLRNAGHVHGGRVDLVVYSLIRADLDMGSSPPQD
jgi:RimJ/RimL family protein N-acetyltransferase